MLSLRVEGFTVIDLYWIGKKEVTEYKNFMLQLSNNFLHNVSSLRVGVFHGKINRGNAHDLSFKKKKNYIFRTTVQLDISAKFSLCEQLLQNMCEQTKNMCDFCLKVRMLAQLVRISPPLNEQRSLVARQQL